MTDRELAEELQKIAATLNRQGSDALRARQQLCRLTIDETALELSEEQDQPSPKKKGTKACPKKHNHRKNTTAEAKSPRH